MKFIVSIYILVVLFNVTVKGSDLSPGQGDPESVDHCYREVFMEAEKVLPNFDPIEFDSIKFNYPGEMISANANVSNAVITGLSNYRIVDIQFSKTEPIVTFHILLPFIQLYAEYYEFDGHIFYVVPLKGQGVARFDVHNLQLKGTISMKKAPNSPAVIINKLEDAELEVDRIESQTEFDHNIDNIVSAIMEDLVAGYINRFNKYIFSTYTDSIIQIINEILINISTL